MVKCFPHKKPHTIQLRNEQHKQKGMQLKPPTIAKKIVYMSEDLTSLGGKDSLNLDPNVWLQRTAVEKSQHSTI